MTLIDFEDAKLTEGTLITEIQNVLFGGGGSVETHPGTPHSGTKYFRVNHPELSEAPPLHITFKKNQYHRVRLFAGAITSDDSSLFGKLTARSHNGNKIGDDGLKPILANACATAFEVSSTKDEIETVTFEVVGIDKNLQKFIPDQIVDDIEFEAFQQPAAANVTVELGEVWKIVCGIVGDTFGVVLGPRGPVPWPPVGPLHRAPVEVRDAVVSLVLAERMGEMSTGWPAEVELQRNALAFARAQIGNALSRLERAY